MESEDRLAALGARVATRENVDSAPKASVGPFRVTEGLVGRGIDGVVFPGSVGLPGGGTLRWQYGLSTAAILGQAWDDAAPVLAALGGPVRLRLLRAVLEGRGRTVELAELPGVGSTGSLYHRLRELVAGGWLAPAGKAAHRVPGERVVPLLAVLASSDARATGETTR